MRTTQPLSPEVARYARRAAQGMLDSLEHYGRTSPPVGDGRIATPAWYANQLGKILNHRGDTLPGGDSTWWGDRWEQYARHLLDTIPVEDLKPRCADHPAFEADYCPSCGTARTIS